MSKAAGNQTLEQGPGVAKLAPAGMAAPASPTPVPFRQPPAAACALAIIATAREAQDEAVVYIASNDRRAEEAGRALGAFAPDLEVLHLPAWDCLPYDRASPSREIMGKRMAVLARLAAPSKGLRVLVVSVEALVQRTPPAKVFREAFLSLETGQQLDRAQLEAFAHRTGYISDDRVDEPGEIAILGSVVDIFPADADLPIRLSLDEGGAINEIKAYDPISQRTAAAIASVRLGPASEALLGADVQRHPGVEHWAPEIYGRMASVLDGLKTAVLVLDPLAEDRLAEVLSQVEEGYEARRLLDKDGPPPLPPERLYLSLRSARGHLARRRRFKLDVEALAPVPNFALERNPGRAFCGFVSAQLNAARRVVLTGLPHELRPVRRALQRGLQLEPEPLAGWGEIASAEAGTFSFEADLDTGFIDAARALVVIAAADVLGGRVARSSSRREAALAFEPDLRPGDVAIHEDHGLGLVKSLEEVEIDGQPQDVLRLEYHGGAELLVPVSDFGKVWRYGAEPDAVSLERLGSEAWTRRRIELNAEIERTAEHLVSLSETREQSPGAPISPPAAAYARFAARFPYPETRDQTAAIDAVLADLASGRVMNRLVCGDVGFGKTEVALRAAAAAVLSGRQVAVVAPTTVLARQHFDIFRRRFAEFDVKVAHLSRLVGSAEARAVRDGLREGSIQVVVGTHAVAGPDVEFRALALVIVDEEQRFGAKLKAQLAGLSPCAHRLTMTATPIPRTLQLALAGVQDTSLIATPPARRRPIRTFVAPYDPATMRTALLREKRRGGQSFVVAPRIEDLAPLAKELHALAPDLDVRLAHGELPAQEADDVMVAFSAGEGDILLATSIIESGLDVPRANTMLIVGAERFGLAQLHQLRGRVGRGRNQGVAYLFHDAEQPLTEATRSRLSALEAHDRLGSGLLLSARDLDLRGAGDLIGEEQAGHLRLIGSALYQRLLSRAVREAKGEFSGPDWTPELNMGLAGSLPPAYVPDPVIRMNIYARLARMDGLEELAEFGEELGDRFGDPPADAQNLLALVRLRMLARNAGVLRVDAGPKAVAFALADPSQAPAKGRQAGLQVSDGRLLGPPPGADSDLAGHVEAILASLAERDEAAPGLLACDA
jgi:transcription-repair coupling factor (superfamily II helicase)